MKQVRNSMMILSVLFMLGGSAGAQINLEGFDLNNLNLESILGKVMNVKKGFAPKFSLGKVAIPKIGKVGEVLGLRNNPQVDKLFKTFRTGRTVYKVGAYLGTALTTYGAVKTIANNAKDQISETLKKDAKTVLISGLSAAGLGLAIKFITKKAAYKAVDMFNGKVKDRLQDILSFNASRNAIPGVQGAGLTNAGIQIHF